MLWISEVVSKGCGIGNTMAIFLYINLKGWCLTSFGRSRGGGNKYNILLCQHMQMFRKSSRFKEQQQQNNMNCSQRKNVVWFSIFPREQLLVHSNFSCYCFELIFPFLLKKKNFESRGLQAPVLLIFNEKQAFTSEQ